MFTARSINMLDWVDVTNASATTRIYPMMSNHIAPPTGRAVAARGGVTTPGESRA